MYTRQQYRARECSCSHAYKRQCWVILKAETNYLLSQRIWQLLRLHLQSGSNQVDISIELTSQHNFRCKLLRILLEYGGQDSARWLCGPTKIDAWNQCQMTTECNTRITCCFHIIKRCSCICIHLFTLFSSDSHREM